MKKFTPLLSLLILLTLSTPFILHATSTPDTGRFGLIVCDGVDDECGFDDLKELFVKGVKALVEVATVITVLALIVMGFKLMTSAGNPQALTETKKRAKWIIVGYVCILAAWLVVYTILNTLVYDEFNILDK